MLTSFEWRCRGRDQRCSAYIPASDAPILDLFDQLYADPGAACADLRISTIVPGAGHWVQQEAPEATNQALVAFLDTL